MKSSRPLPREITNLAVEWLLEKQEGFAPGRAAKFHAWREADQRHALAVAKAERTLALLDELPAMKKPLSTRLEEEAAAEMQPMRRRFWRHAAGWTAAAAAVTFATVAALSWREQDGKAREFNYVSNADRPQQVVLDDGSFVDL